MCFHNCFWIPKYIGLVCALFFSIFCTENILASSDCGNPFVNAYGPFDYTNPDHFKNKLPIVDTHHFTQEVRDSAFRIGSDTKGPLFVVGNLDYTLRAFPNHHGALTAMGSYMIYLQKKDFNQYRTLTEKFRTPECYFQRAIEFKPDDASVQLIYGIYLFKKNELKRSLAQLSKAEQIQPENAEVHYNLGLIYLKQNNIDLSVKHAKKAYSLGYPLPYLREQLTKLGKW
jgi:hypothetical protein